MATYTAVAAGGNWNSSTTWSPAGIPGAADNAILNSSSGNVTLNTSPTCSQLNLSGYAGVLAFGSQFLTVTGILTLNTTTSPYTTSGTGGLVIGGTVSQNIITNGKIWTAAFRIGGTSPILTLNDVLQVSGEVSITSSVTPVINSTNSLDPERFNILGNFTGTSGTCTGNATLKFTGTSNQTWTGTVNNYIRNNVKIDKTGGTLLLAGTIRYDTGTFTYVQGTVNSSTSLLSIRSNATFYTNGSTSSGATTTSSIGINWYNVELGATLSIQQNFTVINTFSNAAAANGIISQGGSSNVYLGGNLSVTLSNSITSPVATITMNGTGTWSGTGTVAAPLIFNTSGTITVSGTVGFSTQTLTYTSGTIVTTSSTLSCTASCTLNCGNMNGVTTNKWNNVTLGGISQTYTLSSNLNLNGTLTLNAGNVNATITLNGFTIYTNGLTYQTVSTTSSGTTNIVFNGTGTWTGAVGANITNNVTIDTLGTLTIAAAISYRTNTLKYLQGTIDTTTNSSTLYITGNCTLETNGITWYNITNSTASIMTLTNNLVWSNNWSVTQGAISFSGAGNLAPTSTANISFLNGGSAITLKNNIQVVNATFDTTLNTNTISINGNLTIPSAGGCAGTTNLILNGTGTWSHTGNTTYISNNLTINTSGTITLGATVCYQTGNLVYTNGTVDTTTNNSTLYVGASTTFNNSIIWDNIQIQSGAATYTIASDLNLVGTLIINIGISATITLNGGNIYTGGLSYIGGNFNSVGTATIIFNGTGTWSHNNSAYTLRNNIIINTTGTLTISNNVTCNGNTLQYINGTVNTFGSLFTCTNCNLIGNIRWYDVNMGNMTLTEDFYFNGAFNNSSTGNTTINGANIYCMGGTLEGFGNSSNITGTSKFIFKENSSWGSNYQISSFLDIIIDCNTLTLPTSFTGKYAIVGDSTVTYLRGKTNKNSCLIIVASGDSTLINFNKIIIDNIKISSGVNLNMNEFFSGRPDRKTNILSSATANYTITFTDNFEKIAKFVNLSNCTLTRKNQLLMLTNIPDKKSNIGVRFFNTLPNGVPENKPSVNQGMVYGANFLTSDPCFN